jgi:hypothetical protein
MARLINDFTTNLRAGMCLAFFRRCGPGDFRVGLDQFVLLVALDLSLEIVSDFLLHLPQPEFYVYAFPIYTFSLGCFLLAAYLIGKLARNDAAPLRIGIMVYSFVPLTVVLQFLIRHLEPEPSLDEAASYPWPSYAFSAYVMALLGRALYLASGRIKRVAAAAFVLMLPAIGIPQHYFAGDDEFWYVAEDEGSAVEEQDAYAEYRVLDAETLLYRQPEMLAQALDELAPQRQNVADLFFVGFAGYAHEDVFSKEVVYAKRLLDERFDTYGHSLNLVNHLHTRDSVPLATATNLALALKRIGELMDPDEDVLLLYLTSHGSETHELSVDFWPLPLNAITPESLRAMLDAAAIKWRVVIVSACYSGGFISALQEPGTVVATAAAADRTSFGCGNEFDFTYFGEALFKDQLQRQYSLITALQQAKIAISERENREKLEPSLPQLSVGTGIEPKLQHLGEELRLRNCGAPRRRSAGC